MLRGYAKSLATDLPVVRRFQCSEAREIDSAGRQLVQIAKEESDFKLELTYCWTFCQMVPLR